MHDAPDMNSSEKAMSVLSRSHIKQKRYRRCGKVSDRFPNVQLYTQDNQPVHFYDDLIKDKAVIVDFMWTSCTDNCPVKTQNLINIHRLLGHRVGRDIFLLSISIDGNNDTPEALTRYIKENGGAKTGWLYLTGDPDDVESLRYSLGVYDLDPNIDALKRSQTKTITFGNDRTNQWAYLPASMDSKRMEEAISSITRDSRPRGRTAIVPIASSAGTLANNFLKRFKNPVFASKSYRYLARQMAQDLANIEGGKSIVFSSATDMATHNEILLMFSHFLQDELVSTVLIIDATFRGNGLTKLMKMGDREGLIDILSNGGDNDSFYSITQSLKENISFIAAGDIANQKLTYVSDTQVQSMINKFKQDYDYVILQQDFIQEDTRYLPFAKLSDMVLVHLKERSTPIAKFEEAQEVFMDHRIKNVKIIMSEP